MDKAEILDIRRDLVTRLHALFERGNGHWAMAVDEFLIKQKLLFVMDEDRRPQNMVRHKAEAAWQNLPDFKGIAPKGFFFVKGAFSGPKYYLQPIERMVNNIDILANPSRVKPLYHALLERGCQLSDPALSRAYAADGPSALSSTLNRALMTLHEFPSLLFNETEIDVNFRILLRGTAPFEKRFNTSAIEKQFWVVTEQVIDKESQYFSAEINAIQMILHYFSEFSLNELEPDGILCVRLHKLVDLFLFSQSKDVDWKMFWTCVEQIGCQNIVGEFLVLFEFIFGADTRFSGHIQPSDQTHIMYKGAFVAITSETLFQLLQMNVRDAFAK
ncbi:MAG: nucleotidyltransferase family protein [Sulfitobacter sp.]